jgi:hypothetical protein
MNLVEETSRQPRVQAAAWGYLAAFSQVYYENWEQKAEQGDWKNLKFTRRRTECKVGAKENVAIELARTIKKKPSTLQDYRKDAWRLLRKWPDPRYSRLNGVKVLTHWQVFGLRRGLPAEVFHSSSYLGIQKLL